MNEEQIRKIASETFTENIMNNLDSSIIFKYIQELEQENQELKSQLSNSHQIKNQQKEFIEYLKEQIQLCKDKIFERGIIGKNLTLQLLKLLLKTYKEILSKYKEIIGENK